MPDDSAGCGGKFSALGMSQAPLVFIKSVVGKRPYESLPLTGPASR